MHQTSDASVQRADAHHPHLKVCGFGIGVLPQDLLAKNLQSFGIFGRYVEVVKSRPGTYSNDHFSPLQNSIVAMRRSHVRQSLYIKSLLTPLQAAGYVDYMKILI